MAKDEINVGKWVDDRLAGLDSSADWQPDSSRGLARLNDRRRAARRHRIEWIMATAAGLAACAFLLVFLSPGACARPRGCSGDLSNSVGPAAAPAPTTPTPAPTVAHSPAPVPAGAPYKQSGLPGAPIVCEIYTDYECPSCSLLYKDIVPMLVDQYVRTGKVRLVHRDFPLRQHPYARLAARYANAAGTIGRYETVVNQIFRTQNSWSVDGNIEAQLIQILTPQDLKRVRDLVANDQHLDDTVTSDTNMAMQDRINQTPTLIIVAGGKRQAIAGVPQFSMLQTYLDQLLTLH